MPLDKMFPAKKKPRGFDSGPPAADGGGESRTAGGGDEGDMMASDAASGGQDDSGAGYGDHEAAAADDLADLCGVSPEDRSDFLAAFKSFVHSCIASVMGEQDNGGGGDGSGDY